MIRTLLRKLKRRGFVDAEARRLFEIYRDARDKAAAEGRNLWMQEGECWSGARPDDPRQSDDDLRRLAHIHAGRVYDRATPLPRHIQKELAAGKSIEQIQDDWLNKLRRKSYEGTPESRLRKCLTGRGVELVVSTVPHVETLGGFKEACRWGLENGWLTERRESESLVYTPTEKAWALRDA